MEYALVGIGGALGGVARYCIGKRIAKALPSGFPWATFFINITGALLFGFVVSLQLSGSLYIFLAEGFFGAYTTFSTFMHEGFQLFQANERKNAAVYVLFSLLLGIFGFIGGFGLGSNL